MRPGRPECPTAGREERRPEARRRRATAGGSTINGDGRWPAEHCPAAVPPRLEEGGLIETRKDGRVRTCALRVGALAPAKTWMEAQRLLWEGRHDRLEDYLATLTTGDDHG